MPTYQKTRQIFEFIQHYIASNGEAPTIAEIGTHFSLSAGGVYLHLKKMEFKGWITRVPNVSRGIRIVEQRRVA